MKGIITRVTLENFVTYKSVEFRPGRNLNVIIGPNGTGKSTIVCAIVLGLGGKPKVVARGNNVGAYVKEGCESAMIEIELFNPDGKNYVITRTIDLHNKSTWALNGKSYSQKAIEDIIRDLHIQVDNLCQFLPQDRVQDFAKMDQRSLLENTEKTVGTPEMFNDHMRLKEMRSQQLDTEKNIDTIRAKAATEQQRNDRNAVQVSNLAEKKFLVDMIFTLKQKRAWVNYYALKDGVKELKKDKDLAEVEKNKYETLFRPLEVKIRKAKALFAKEKEKMDKFNDESSKKLNLLKSKMAKVERDEESIDEQSEQLQKKIAEEGKRAGEIEKQNQIINKLQNDFDEMNQDSDADINAKITQLQPQIHACSVRITNLNNGMAERQAEMESVSNELRARQAEKNKEEDAHMRRLSLLQTKSRDAHTGFLWLRDNTHRFKGTVYGPMMLEINVIDARHAKYVEDTISKNDLIAFACEESDDVTTLTRFLRDEQKLRVNVVHAPLDERKVYTPQRTIENLKQWGFYTYVRETFTAPPAIMQYLCKNCNVHTVPIGDRSVHKNYERFPRDIRTFFSDTDKFNVKISFYTNEPSVSNGNINPPNFLVISVNAVNLQRINDRIQQLTSDQAQLTEQGQQFTDQRRQEEQELNKLRNTKQRLTDKRDSRKTIAARLRSKIQQREQLIRECCDVNQLKEKHRQNCCKIVVKLCEAQQEILRLTKELHKAMLDSHVLKEEVNYLREKVVTQENEAIELKARKQAAEAMVRNLENRIINARQELKTFRNIAVEMTEGQVPDTPGFAHFETAFTALPTDLEELDSAIEEKQGKVDCLGSDNDHLLAEFEQRKKLISELNETIATNEVDTVKLQANMDIIKARWLPPLQDLIDRINTNFGNSFNQLGCAGEVSLSKGENENDFHLYGMCIKVKYRDGEQLQELNQHLQSGGERAVATAIYMISLQELTNVPFRCVDEINQGMDPINERLIFELLVRTTSQSDTAQYFLLTPKLLPSLLYERTVNVVCVNNGRYCVKADWNSQKFFKLKREINARNNDSGSDEY